MKTTKVHGLNIDYRHTFADGCELARVTVIDGRKRDSYAVTRKLDSLEVTWKHMADVARTYSVICTTSGVAIACDCKGSEFTGHCKHRTGTTKLIEAGELANGPAEFDPPAEWCYENERVDYYSDCLAVGPAIHEFRD